MIKTVGGLLALTIALTGCSAFQPESATTEIVLGDCRNGAIMTQATFGGPLRCGPQSESPSPQVEAAPES